MSTGMSDTQTSHGASYVQYEQIILFGDSITQGSANQDKGFAFLPALQNEYTRRYDVLNRGFSGYTSEQGLVVLPQIFPPVEKETVRLMTIFFGANDAVLPGGSQHVPLETYKQCLQAMIKHPAVQAQRTKILLFTPPPVNEYQLDPVLANGDVAIRLAAVTKQYADACREVGESLGVAVVDIWTAFMTAVGWTKDGPLAGSKDAPPNEKLAALLSDGLHFNPAGYRIMFDEVMKVIRLSYPEELPDHVPVKFALWADAPRK
ncbi:hypothetical protein AJ80_09265 [Polytolypa hystricis UAMH7299]|uniref:SGNH hydrolase-type esterase domain-containing protein n=1 Tax=Polytolypa hystricis (strain UAMH7299) TaxID=1447883 RepID=A0A2B7WTW4_POLH7|nr:hypothetical protein AJ80_09265 [Polytolypa hystricis UAMH7299]